MVKSSINIKSELGDLLHTSSATALTMPQITSEAMNVSVHIEDIDQNIVDTTLHIHPNNFKIILYDKEEYEKKASLYFGSLFSGSFSPEYMWQLLATPSSEQINESHFRSVTNTINEYIRSVEEALHIHELDYNKHLTNDDRDFINRLKIIYGSEFNAALDYLILKNPYTGEINITNQQIALYAGYGGFTAYGGLTDVSVEFYNIDCIPTKSGGEPTVEAFNNNNNTYGYGITTLIIPNEAPNDLTAGEIAIYNGTGGFSSISDIGGDTDLIIGYYSNGIFYADVELTTVSPISDEVLYLDLLGNGLYRYDTLTLSFIALSSQGVGGFISGYYVDTYTETDPNTQETTTREAFFASKSSDTPPVYSDEITPTENILYLDLDANTLYRYDSTLHSFIAIASAGGDGFIVQGYRNPADGLFYATYETDTFSNVITGNNSKLYYDKLTSEVYYYNLTTFDRYHHKVSIDYLLLNTNYTGTIAPGLNKMALYVGEGGFNAAALSEEDEVVAGYYYRGNFYREDTYETLITPDPEAIYADLDSNNIYLYRENTYVQVSGGGSSTSGVTSHSMLQDRFSVGYNPIGEKYEHDIDVIAGLREALIKNVSPPITLTREADGIIIGFGSVDIVHPTGNVVSGLSLDSYGRITAYTKDTSSIDRDNNTIAKRRLDASLAANYFALASNYTEAIGLNSGESAIYLGQGGFTSTSGGGGSSVEFIYEWGPEAPDNLEDSVYQAYVLYNKIEDLSSRISNIASTIDHTELNHRFSTDFADTVEYQHDINVISGLRSELNSLVIGVSSPLTITNATIGKTIGLEGITVSVPNPLGNVISTLTIDSFGRTTAYTTEVFDTNIIASTIAKRKTDASLSASYYTLTYGHTGDVITAQQEAAMFIGEGGFTSTSNDNNYYMYDSWVSPIVADSVYSARVLWDTISNLQTSGGGLSNPYTGVNGIVIDGTEISIDLATNSGLVFFTDTADNNKKKLRLNSIVGGDNVKDVYKIKISNNNIPYLDVPSLLSDGGGLSLTASSGKLSVSSIEVKNGAETLFTLTPGSSITKTTLQTKLGIINSVGAGLDLDNTGLYLNLKATSFNDDTNRKYYLQNDTNGLFVNVPWTGGGSNLNITNGNGISITGSDVKTISVNYLSNELLADNQGRLGLNLYEDANDNGTKYYLQAERNGLFVKVPWTDTDTTYNEGYGIDITSGNTINNEGVTGITSGNTNGTFRFKLGNGGYQEQVIKGLDSAAYKSENYFALSGHTHSGYLTSITSAMVTSALGYTPYNSTNPNHYTSNVGTVTGIKVASSDTKTPNSNGIVDISGAFASSSHSHSDYLSLSKESTQTTSGSVTIGGTLNVSGNIIATGDIKTTYGKFYDSSDIRLKKNIKEIFAVINAIEELPIVRFEYKEREGKEYIGTIAQKLLPLFPELVSQDNEGFYSVDYGGLAAVAIQGIKELAKRLELLEDRMNGY